MWKNLYFSFIVLLQKQIAIDLYVVANCFLVMVKLKTILLITWVFFLTAFCYSGNYNCNVKDGAPNNHGGQDKSSSITESINGHSLTVAFSQNLGEVSIDISTADGVTIYCDSIQTPTGYQYYIPNTGSYVVTFTLSNSDEYYGEFEVTDY